MFRKLVSNLPFSPQLLSQLSFYGKRLSREGATRKLVVIFSVLAMGLQFFSIVVPAERTNATQSNQLDPEAASTPGCEISIVNGPGNNGIKVNPTGTIASATVVVTNHPNCSKPVTLAVWKLPNASGKPLSAQEFFGSSGGMYGPGKHKISVGLPDCYWQVDLLGQLRPKSIYGDANYQWPQDALANYRLGGSKSCKSSPTPTPSPSPSPSPSPTPPPACDGTGSGGSQCIVLSKKISNLSRPKDDPLFLEANNSTVHAGETLQYTLFVRNPSTVVIKDFIVKENVTDILEYADITDLSGAKLSGQEITWPAISIRQGQTVAKTFKVKIKDPVPTTPASSAMPFSFDGCLENAYGESRTKVCVDKPVPKVIEETSSELPNTGVSLNVALTTGFVILVTYFFLRNRQLVKEIGLIKHDYVGDV